MATAVLASFCAALVLSNVARAQEAPPASALQSTVWRWVHSVINDDSVIVPTDSDRYTVTFGTDGTLSVRADCNQVTGFYHQSGRRLTLQLGPSTLVACPPDSQADEFLKELGAVVSQVSTDTFLVLNLARDSGSMVFEPQPALSLEGTTWTVQSYNNGNQAVTTPLQNTEMTAVFQGGTVAGNAGCNSYHGAYTVDGTSISIGPLVVTRRVCGNNVMAQEQAFLTALQAATQYELNADRLSLRDDDGALQVDFLPASSQ